MGDLPDRPSCVRGARVDHAHPNDELASFLLDGDTSVLGDACAKP